MITARGCESARKNPRICGVLIVFGQSVQSKDTSLILKSGSLSQLQNRSGAPDFSF
jgi:hypothetical protein